MTKSSGCAILTPHDFYWSWKRFLTPETASQYAYQLFYVKNAKKYASGMSELEIGDRLEIEEANRPRATWQYPSGDIHYGELLERVPAKPTIAENATEEEQEAAKSEWLATCLWVVEIKPEVDGEIDWEAEGEIKRFRLGAAGEEFAEPQVIPCRSVLLSFSEVGIRAPDDRTFEIELESPTPFFKYLCAFYPMYPVMRECIEEYGEPGWTKPGQIATCGPFHIQFRRIRDRIRLRKNEDHWNAESVSLETVDALVSGSDTTALNMYLDGQADWTTTVPGRYSARHERARGRRARWRAGRAADRAAVGRLLLPLQHHDRRAERYPRASRAEYGGR